MPDIKWWIQNLPQILSFRTTYGVYFMLTEHGMLPPRRKIHSRLMGWLVISGCLAFLLDSSLSKQQHGDMKTLARGKWKQAFFFTFPSFAGILSDCVPPLWRWFQYTTTSRKRADPCAYQEQRKRVSEGRLVQKGRVDVYLPPPTSAKTIPGLVFLPGALVDHAAYSQAIGKLSDGGALVAVLSLEPLRLAAPLLGADASDVQHAASVAESTFLRLLNQSGNNHEKMHVEWAVGGHSMGAYRAMSLLHEEESSKEKLFSNTKSTNTKLVLWATGRMLPLVPDLSHRTDLQILLVQGSNDKIANFQKPEEKEAFMKRMPTAMTTIYTVEGGNHGGFAAYPVHPMDGERSVSLDAQHEEAAKQTLGLLLD